MLPQQIRQDFRVYLGKTLQILALSDKTDYCISRDTNQHPREDKPPGNRRGMLVRMDLEELDLAAIHMQKKLH